MTNYVEEYNRMYGKTVEEPKKKRHIHWGALVALAVTPALLLIFEIAKAIMSVAGSILNFIF